MRRAKHILTKFNHRLVFSNSHLCWNGSRNSGAGAKMMTDFADATSGVFEIFAENIPHFLVIVASKIA